MEKTQSKGLGPLNETAAGLTAWRDTEEDSFIQAIAKRDSARLADRFVVWVTVTEACNIFFPRPALSQRFSPVRSELDYLEVDLLPDRANQAARRTALSLLEESRKK
jgi:hypothetical protein